MGVERLPPGEIRHKFASEEEVAVLSAIWDASTSPSPSSRTIASGSPASPPSRFPPATPWDEDR